MSQDKGKEKAKEEGSSHVSPTDEVKKNLKTSGFYKKSKVSFEKEYRSVRVREFGEVDVTGATLVEGFPSVSLASILTTGYLREQLKLPLIGVISSSAFPPRAIIEGGKPSHPIRIFGDKRLVTILCEFKLPSNEVTYDVVDAILDFSERHKCSMVITIEGIPEEADEKGKFDEKLSFISTNKQFSEAMLALDHKPLSDAIIAGVTGLILAEGSLRDINLGCLLAPAAANYPDAHGAVNVVKALASWLKEPSIDIKPLEESANKLQSSISQFLKSEKDQSKSPAANMFL